MDEEMKKLFSGYPVHFAGQLVGKKHTVCILSFIISYIRSLTI